MFDFFKSEINDAAFAENLMANDLLNFKAYFNIDTGEVDEIFKATYQNLHFTVYPSSRVFIWGSLHKYKNLGQHNYDDFNITLVRETIHDLYEKFGLDPILTRLHNLEIGLNIMTPFNPNILIKGLVAYSNQAFSSMEMIGRGQGKFVRFDHYKLKIYDKGLQYSLPFNLLRIEKKITRMINLKKGAVYLNDLANIEFANDCLENLLEAFEEIIVTEKINKELLTKNEFKIYHNCSNPRYWETAKKNERYRRKHQITEIIRKCGDIQLKPKTIKLLSQKKEELLNHPLKLCTF